MVCQDRNNRNISFCWERQFASCAGANSVDVEVLENIVILNIATAVQTEKILLLIYEPVPLMKPIHTSSFREIYVIPVTALILTA